LINTPSSKNTQKQNTNLTEVLQKKEKKKKQNRDKTHNPLYPQQTEKNKHQPTQHTTKVTHKQKLEKKLCLLLQQRR
jgi:hypothetical protein